MVRLRDRNNQKFGCRAPRIIIRGFSFLHFFIILSVGGGIKKKEQTNEGFSSKTNKRQRIA